MAIAKGLGVDLLPKDDAEPKVELDAPKGPTIADVAAVVPAPGVGVDTMAATREVLKRLAG